MIVDNSEDLFTVALLISSPAGHLWLIHSRHVVYMYINKVQFDV